MIEGQLQAIAALFGEIVTWLSKKQIVVAKSNVEAELRSVAHGVCEGLWLKLLLEELKVPLQSPLQMFCNNKIAISIFHNVVHHDRTKHVEVDRHFIKEKIEEGMIMFTYVFTKQQIADLLPKWLFRQAFEKLLDKQGIFNMYCPD